MQKYLKFTLFCLLAVLVLWWFGRSLDWNLVRAAISRADWRLIAIAVATVCTTYLMRAFRWRVLLAPLAQTSIRELFAATTVGFGALFLLGRAGEVMRPAFLSLRDKRVRPAASFVTIAVERLYDMVAIVVLFAANLVWFRLPGGSTAEYERVRIAGFVLLAGAALGIAMLVWFRHNSEKVINWINAVAMRLPGFGRRVVSFITNLMEQLAQALGVLVSLRALAATIGWTILLWAAIVTADWLMFRAFGLPFGLGETIFVMGWSLVGSLVPTPGGGAGAFHAATAGGLVFLGVNREQAAAVAIVTHLVLFAPAVVFGLYYFLRSDVQLARLWQSTESKEIAARADERHDLEPASVSD